MNVPFIDFHNHNIWHTDEVLEVVSVHGHQQKQKKYYTIGYHPWWTLERLAEPQLALLSESYADDPFCLGLGEFGLDNLKGADLDLQEEIFMQQIEVANQLSAPVIVHCVRAYDRMIRLRANYGKTPWVIHGFVRNHVLAGQLLDKGFYLSVAPHEKMNKVFVEMLQYIPLDRTFIETDSEFNTDIWNRYRIFAGLRSESEDKVREVIFENFKIFFDHKWKRLNGANAQHF